MSEADEVEVGELEAGKGDRGPDRIRSREREGDTVERWEDRGGGGEVRDDEAGVGQEARGAQQRREGVRLATRNRTCASLDGRLSSRVGLSVPNRERRKERKVHGWSRGGQGAEVAERGDGMGGRDETRDRRSSGGDSP